MVNQSTINQMEFVVCCVGAFTQRFHHSNAQFYTYLCRFDDIAFPLNYYEAEHTLSIDDAVEDLAVICQKKGGRVA